MSADHSDNTYDIRESLPTWALARVGTQARETPLFDDERDHLTTAGAKRRREFTSVLAYAASALASLNMARESMTPDQNGRSPWPTGFIGSMSHSHGCYAVITGPGAPGRTVGIDCEPNLPLPASVREVALSHHEDERVCALAGSEESISWDRLILSAKESIYKAWHPIYGTCLGFEEVEVAPQLDGTFSVSPAAHLAASESAPFVRRLHGAWGVEGTYLITACWPAD